VPLGVRPPAAFDADARAEADRWHALERPYVLSVGTAEPRKNLSVLVEAMRALGRDDVDLVLVGPAGWGEDVATLVAPLGDRVQRLGFVPDADLGHLYAGAAAFAYPSRWEGFGLPVLEAMAHGAPVVTSAGTACAEVAGDAGLLVAADDSAALGQALARLLVDPAEADRRRALGRARAAELTWERTADLTADAYAEAKAMGS
jgi:glycosyltransferase involved in cell wall biosynthesis